MKILVMGLPGAGKTWLATKIAKWYKIAHFDGDIVRDMFGEYDFSEEGRERQAYRMYQLAQLTTGCVASFVCPTPECREIFSPDNVIWMDTIDNSKFVDTNQMFISPEKYDCRVVEKVNESIINEMLLGSMARRSRVAQIEQFIESLNQFQQLP